MLAEYLELLKSRSDLLFDSLRYVSWLLPTLGFIGTVIGISISLEIAGTPPISNDSIGMRDWMSELTSSLGVAFNTTLLGLILSAIVMLLQTNLQTAREGSNYGCTRCLFIEANK